MKTLLIALVAALAVAGCSARPEKTTNAVYSADQKKVVAQYGKACDQNEIINEVTAWYYCHSSGSINHVFLFKNGKRYGGDFAFSGPPTTASDYQAALATIDFGSTSPEARPSETLAASASTADITCKHVVERLRMAPNGYVDNLSNCHVQGHKVTVTLQRTMYGTSPEELMDRFKKLPDAEHSARANLNDPHAIVEIVNDRGGKLMSSDEMY